MPIIPRWTTWENTPEQAVSSLPPRNVGEMLSSTEETVLPQGCARKL